MRQQLIAAAEKLVKYLDETQIAKMLRAKRHQAKLEILDEEIAKMERDLRDKRSEREGVAKKVESIMKAAVGGGKARARGRAGNLGATIEKVLEKAAKPLGLTDIAKAVLAAGHDTRSAFANFRTTVAHKLRTMKGVLIRSGEGYSVRKAAGAKKKRNTAKTKRKSKTPAEAAATAGAAATA